MIVLGHCQHCGIIPTCVGSTLTDLVQAITNADHPHLRGEHRAARDEQRVGEGSSPPAWGAQGCHSLDRHPLGIIPTCVGSTSTGTRCHPRGWDHPHLRGEHHRGRAADRPAFGSSPPAWGAPRNPRSVGSRYGIIPTCVGSTTPRKRGLATTRDHPHLRGEHKRLYLTLSEPRGSSPPAWGAP